jgi:hypothetical protein
VKGILYKEWCLGKRRFFGFLLLAVLLSVLGILVSLSLQFGNLQGENTAVVQIFFYLPYLILLFSVELCLQSVYRDYASGWMKYSYTMPLTIGKAVGARYLTCMLLIGFSFVYTLVYSVMLGAVSIISYQIWDLKNQLLLLAVACILISIFMPLAFYFKTGRSVSAIAIGLLVVSYTGIGFAMMVGMGNGINPSKLIEKVKDLQTPGILIGLLVAAVGIAISFMYSCRIYGRRERA